MKLMPMYDKVMIEEIKEENKSTIVLPETTKATLLRGKVVAYGSGFYNHGTWVDMTVRLGTIILYPRYANTVEYTEDNKKYIILSESDIIGIFKD